MTEAYLWGIQSKEKRHKKGFDKKAHGILPFMYEKRRNKKTCTLHLRAHSKDKAENAEWGQTEGRGQYRRDTVKYIFLCSFDFLEPC